MKKLSNYYLILLLFFILSLIYVRPSVLVHLTDMRIRAGDDVINICAFDWELKSILKGDFSQIFDSNIFYPCEKTVLFGNHVFSTVLLTLPIYALTHNPQLCSNMAVFFSFVLAGFGMFLLAKYLVKNTWAAVLAGIIFAFCEYRIYIGSYIELSANYWMPFTLLYMHKYFDTKNKKYLALFILFFNMQILACGYYFIFFSLIVAVILGLLMSVRTNRRDKELWKGLILFFAISALVVVVFYAPYLVVKQNYGFERSVASQIHNSAHLQNYLASPHSLFLGKLTGRFGKIEGRLNPGFLCMMLAAIGMTVFIKKRTSVSGKIAPQVLYTVIALICFLLSLGPVIHLGNKALIPGPYLFLSRFVPGFNGVRAVSRIGGLVPLGLAVLSAFGINYLRQRFGKKMYLIIVLVLLEYLPVYVLPSHPESMWQMIVKARGNQYGTEGRVIKITQNDYLEHTVPEVYKWLKSQKDNFAILELPVFPVFGDATYYMYASIYHGKYLVNGHSGYQYTGFFRLRKILHDFPSRNSLDAISAFGPRFLVIHSDRMNKDVAAKMKNKLGPYTLIKTFDSDLVYEDSAAQTRFLDMRRLMTAGIYLPGTINKTQNMFLRYQPQLEGKYYLTNRKLTIPCKVNWIEQETNRKVLTKNIKLDFYPNLWIPGTMIEYELPTPEKTGAYNLNLEFAGIQHFKETVSILP